MRAGPSRHGFLDPRGGVYAAYILGTPAFVNAGFREVLANRYEREAEDFTRAPAGPVRR